MPGNRNILYLMIGALGGAALFTIAVPAAAQQVSREQDIVNLRLGQRIKVDDDELEREALEWSTTRGSRSGRVAWQFTQELAGRLGVRLAGK